MKVEAFAIVDETGVIITHDTHQMYGGHGGSFFGPPLLFVNRDDAEAYIAHTKLDRDDEAAKKFRIEPVTIVDRLALDQVMLKESE